MPAILFLTDSAASSVVRVHDIALPSSLLIRLFLSVSFVRWGLP
jgi:hypothetical protein